MKTLPILFRLHRYCSDPQVDLDLQGEAFQGLCVLIGEGSWLIVHEAQSADPPAAHRGQGVTGVEAHLGSAGDEGGWSRHCG